VSLTLPVGWTVQPASAPFRSPPQATPNPSSSPSPRRGVRIAAQSTPYAIKAVASTGDSTAICNLASVTCYSSGWQSVGYPGLRPYNLYKPAQLLTRKVDVKLAPGLRIGYIMAPATWSQTPLKPSA